MPDTRFFSPPIREAPGITLRPGSAVFLLPLMSPGCTNLLGLAVILCGLLDAFIMLAL